MAANIGVTESHSQQDGQMNEKQRADGAPPPPPKHQPNEKQEHDSQQDGGHGKQDKQPAGGYDSTPIPKRPPGYTIKVTMHRANNLPMSDINSLSSDPYIIAQIDSETPRRHKDDPPLQLRTPTVRRSVDPEWNTDWIVANVPSSGFRLKLRLYDEDPADNDDRLGNVVVHVPSLSEGWEGISKQPYNIAKRMGSKRAYLIRAVAVCFRMTHHMHGELYVSIKMLGRTQEDGQYGRLYTVGTCWSTRHYSPLLGRLANIQEPDEPDNSGQPSNQQKAKKKAERYNFQANQIQLPGPVPPQLYHRYVEFRPFVKRMFNKSGVQGFLLGKALHHQHNRVYNFDRSTVWTHFAEKPGQDVTNKFLELVHYDQGGRIFTYVLTLDALWRFTETGKEFGIDMLSKHTMHSDVSMYIAFSGEFFIRRLKHPRRPPPPDPAESSSHVSPPEHKDNPSHPPDDIDGGPPDAEPPKDPSFYELVIDNDSGTYRPNAKLLPELKKFLARNLPGLHIQTLDCQADADKMGKMKDEQRERKKKEGDHIIFKQGSRASSISSSDEEDLDEMAARMSGDAANEPNEHGPAHQAARDAKRKQEARWNKVKNQYGGGGGGRLVSGDGEGGEATGP